METVGVRELKNRLSEFVRRARDGETIKVSSHGEIVAELRSPTPGTLGLQGLIDQGIIRRIPRNDPSLYKSYDRDPGGATAQELLDWDRDER